MKKGKQAIIVIPIDPLNKDNEQFRDYQRDGLTVRVAIGMIATVPLWVAERAKEIGDIQDFKVV